MANWDDIIPFNLRKDKSMFKDSSEGQTHYENDGCGEPAHNSMPANKKLEEMKNRLTEVFNDEIDKYFPKGIDKRRSEALVVGSMIIAEALKFTSENYIPREEVRKLIAGEINIANKEGGQSSRLTSLAMKLRL